MIDHQTDERRGDLLVTVRFLCTRIAFPREFQHMQPNERTAFNQGAIVTLPMFMAAKFVGEGVAVEHHGSQA